MNEQTYQEEKKEAEKTRYATTFENQKSSVQGALFVLWRIHHKKYQAGSQLFYNEITQQLAISKTAYKEALAFLEGAGLVVNEVVIADKVPQPLVERYGLL